LAEWDVVCGVMNHNETMISTASLEIESSNSSFPIALLTVLVILFPLIYFKPFLSQLYPNSLTSWTPLFTLALFPQHLSRLG